jgi:hypothetical protein
LRAFAAVDMAFVGGDDLVPWSPAGARLLALVNHCLVAGTPLLGDEVSAQA